MTELERKLKRTLLITLKSFGNFSTGLYSKQVLRLRWIIESIITEFTREIFIHSVLITVLFCFSLNFKAPSKLFFVQIS